MEIQGAVAKATTIAGKQAAARQATPKVEAQQKAAAQKAKQQQAQAKQQKQQQAKQQAAENNANIAKVQRMEQVQLARDAVQASAAASQMNLIPRRPGNFQKH